MRFIAHVCRHGCASQAAGDRSWPLLSNAQAPAILLHPCNWQELSALHAPVHTSRGHTLGVRRIHFSPYQCRVPPLVAPCAAELSTPFLTTPFLVQSSQQMWCSVRVLKSTHLLAYVYPVSCLTSTVLKFTKTFTNCLRHVQGRVHCYKLLSCLPAPFPLSFSRLIAWQHAHPK